MWLEMNKQVGDMSHGRGGTWACGPARFALGSQVKSNILIMILTVLGLIQAIDPAKTAILSYERSNNLKSNAAQIWKIKKNNSGQ